MSNKKKMVENRGLAPLSEQFMQVFITLEDPRRTGNGNIKYPLMELFFLTVSSVICGFSDFVHIKDFGDDNLTWLRKFFPYSNGICSDDTLRKLFQKIDYKLFNACVTTWAKQAFQLSENELISIDGKRVCGSFDTYTNTLAAHVLTAYASSHSICLGQVVTDQKSNEITAIPGLIDSIDVEGCIVSIDAMGCQKDIAEKIVTKKGHYLLAVKNNQKQLHEDIIDLFDSSITRTSFTTSEVGHGRVEKRTATLITDLETMVENKDWKNLKSIIEIKTERTDKLTKKTSYETRHYIASFNHLPAEKINALVREHWAIENKLHWHLDVNFDEDSSRKRIGNSAKNFNLISKLALALFQRDTTPKLSIKRKKIKAIFNPDYREKLMGI